MATSSANQQTIPLKMSCSGTEIFRKSVTYIIKEWPSLNLAIENGMGGPQAHEKQNWMSNHITEVMLKGTDIDLEDYLAEIVNQEFDTLIEDGSLEYNTKWIYKFYKDCLQGKEQEVLNSINQASMKKQSLGNMKVPPPVDITQDSSDDEEDEEIE